MSEAVDKILTRHTGETGAHLDVVKRELSEAGMVIKVERELPDFKLFDAKATSKEWQIFRKPAEEEMRGIVAVEPLILNEGEED